MSIHLNGTRALGKRILVLSILVTAAMAAALWIMGAGETPAQAQSPTGNAPVPHDLPSTSPLIPDDLGVGDRFRLIHLTNRQVDVSDPLPIRLWNRFAVNDAARHPETYHPFLAAQYRVVAADGTTSAVENTATHGQGVPIYWLNGPRVADDYADFHAGGWSNAAATDALGRPHPNTGAVVWTGPAPSDALSEFHAMSPVFTVVEPEDIVRPPMVTDITAVASAEHGRITVSWQPSEGAAEYWIQRRAPGSRFYDDWTMRLTTDTQFVDSDVEPGIYEYQVQAHINGTLSHCCPTLASVRMPHFPARVEEVKTDIEGRGSAEMMLLSWQHVEDEVYPVTGYIVRRSTREGDEHWRDTQEVSLSEDDYRVLGKDRIQYLDQEAIVSADVEYRYRVKAVSEIGASRQWSEPVISLEDYRPARVEEVAVEHEDGGRLRLSWPAPNDRGSDIETYDHAYRYGDSGNYQRIRTRGRGASSEMITNPMVPGATVEIKVRAANRYGRGPWSEPTAVQIPGIMVDEAWEAAPDGMGPGDSFRLMFVTSGTRDATAGSLAPYSDFIAEHAARNELLEEYADGFAPLASVNFTDASEHTDTHPSYGGVPVYWVGDDRIADDYADLYDGSWANVAATDENGEAVPGGQVWTGSEYDGTYYPSFALGNPQASVGLAQSGNTGEEISAENLDNSQERPLYGLSPVFTIAESPADTD